MVGKILMVFKWLGAFFLGRKDKEQPLKNVVVVRPVFYLVFSDKKKHRVKRKIFKGFRFDKKTKTL